MQEFEPNRKEIKGLSEGGNIHMLIFSNQEVEICSANRAIYSYFHNGCQSGSACPMTRRHVPVTCRWGSPSFLLAEFTQGHSKNWKTVKLRQRSIGVQPVREKMKSLKHVKLRVDT